MGKWLFVLFLAGTYGQVWGQVSGQTDSLKEDSLRARKFKVQMPADRVNQQYDFGDLERNVFHPRRKADTTHVNSGVIVVPNIAANPTIGAQLGIKAVASRRLGDDPKTLLSVGATSASITTKGILYFYVNHNLFTPGNKWNFQGNLVIAKTVTPDHGFGIGAKFIGGRVADSVLADPSHKGYVLHSIYYNIREKVYKNVAKNLFFGAGMSFEIRTNIENGDSTKTRAPSSVYNNRHGLPQDHYFADGLLFNIEYITRDNPNRPYKGIYFDVGLRANQTWLGSTKNSGQITTDLRKYFSLSAKSPEFVFAVWNWGSYLIGGVLPYLELPGTARDGTYRSGRGYTSQYFKGTQFNDTEAELRFPILANKFISGVVFGNLQTGNDEQGTRIFEVFQPGYGGGLRVLFNKATRTNLALDYAFGQFGNKGFFLNLNETF
ncbi:MAG: BamA/TamA family outer membrane protein [Bacteroidota bacterium]|nr:BamA/TamA family outer membrane protein [Bacteroidota bacterium]MDP4245290.1 BamA/TamA family outer membrane protein [Bacteroidota bacterium]MDP4260200.1 BamA/TamA family outer membrane protein [Bacteroidota bacterium]